MKLQECRNNQPAFGMALKVNKSAIKYLRKAGNINEFEKIIPELKRVAENVDITLKGWEPLPGKAPFLEFSVTPKNIFKINNWLTRSIYNLKNKLGSSTIGISNNTSSAFIFNKAIAAKSKLAKNITENTALRELMK